MEKCCYCEMIETGPIPSYSKKCKKAMSKLKKEDYMVIKDRSSATIDNWIRTVQSGTKKKFLQEIIFYTLRGKEQVKVWRVR